MDLDIHQTRRLYLAGTVPFPTAFPSAGSITIKGGCLHHSCDEHRDNVFVSVQERSGRERMRNRVILQENVSAIFFPGVWSESGEARVFRFAARDDVNDIEEGEWFLKPDINAKKISEKLRIDIGRNDSGARGIVFVPESAPVVTVEEYIKIAGALQELSHGCD